MPLVDVRPPAVDLFFRAGNTLTVTFNWPTGGLAGRTFTSTLGAASLSVGIAGDVMTITATAAQTSAVTAAAVWSLTETTGGGSNKVLIGVWVPSDSPQATSSVTVNVTQGAATVSVMVGTTASSAALTPYLRSQSVSAWPERVFTLDDAVCPATTLSFEHGQAVVRGSGAGSGAQSNRRSFFLIPGSPPGFSRIRSRFSGKVYSSSFRPERGHAHGLGIQADGAIRAIVVWHDILFGAPWVINLGVWENTNPANPGAGTFTTIGSDNADRTTVTAAVRTSNVVTLTVPTGHGFGAGEVIAVDLANNSYDGTFIVTSVTATTIVYDHTGSDLGTSTGTVVLARHNTTKGDLVRSVVVSAAARAAGVVTATVPAGHGFQVGEWVGVDLTDASADGQFAITELPTSTQIRWRQNGSDNGSLGSGTISKTFPYWIESEWRPSGVIRARVWPDIGVANAAPGSLPAGPPPWESVWSMSFDMNANPTKIPDPALGQGCGILAAHLASGSTITEARYDNIETAAL